MEQIRLPSVYQKKMFVNNFLNGVVKLIWLKVWEHYISLLRTVKNYSVRENCYKVSRK